MSSASGYPWTSRAKSEVVTADNVGRKWKWLHGLRWSEINGDLILRHMTSARRREIEFDLKGGTMVMEELTMVGQPLPMGGPIIVSEYSKVPWMTPEFRRRWRIIARAAGIPDEVCNSVSRLKPGANGSAPQTNGHTTVGEFEIPPGSLSP